MTVGALRLNGNCASFARFAGGSSACCSHRSFGSRRPSTTTSLLRGASFRRIELLIRIGTDAVSATRDVVWENAKREPFPSRWALGRSQSPLLLTVACDAATFTSLLDLVTILVPSSLRSGVRWYTRSPPPVGSWRFGGVAARPLIEMCSTFEGPRGRGASRRGSFPVRARRRSRLWSRSVSAGCAAPAGSMMLKRTKAQRQRTRISCPDSDSEANMHCIPVIWPRTHRASALSRVWSMYSTPMTR